VLGHLALVHHPAGALADLPRARVPEPAAVTLDHPLDLLEIGLGERQQLLAFAGALGRELRVATHHQPLIGELRRGDLAQPAPVEQRELKVRRDCQLLDLRCPERGDEPNPLLLHRRGPLAAQRHTSGVSAALQLHPTVTAAGGGVSHPTRSHGASWRSAGLG
jgi:hypothetical protein